MAKSEKGDARAATSVDRAIGVRVRSRRLELRMSQEALANTIGVTFQQIQKYEKGVNRIAASTLVDIADALGVQPAALLPKTDGGLTIALDDAELGGVLAQLNGEGRRILVQIARAFAGDEKLRRKR